MKQTSRVSCPPLFEGLIEGDTVHRPPEVLCHIRFFFLLLIVISFPNRIDNWGRLCTHFEVSSVT